MTQPECELGCKDFSGGEVKHHKDCIHYQLSLSERLDKYEELLSPQKLYDMAELIAEKQKEATKLDTDSVEWDVLQEEWQDWLEDELNINNENK